MPRDDLSIDFVKRMPPAEQLDPGFILEDWVHRTANLPEEIRFVQDEVADKDRQVAECKKTIDDLDGKIQKWIKSHGSHELNPKEEQYRATIREKYDRCDQLSQEKVTLTSKLAVIFDKHLRNLDIQIKQLEDRGEPGFTDPDDLPSLLRPSAANNSAPSPRVTPSANGASVTPLNPILNSATPGPRSSNSQLRNTQTAQQISASAPATPAASMIMNRGAREASAGPGTGQSKRGPRANPSLGSIPVTSSGLARHSSLGPGTPKAQTAAGAQRAGSAGPRASTKGAGAGAGGGGAGRKAGTPSSAAGGRKKAPGSTKSGLSRVKKAAAGKKSPSASTTADSELSDADSNSGDDSSVAGSRRGGGGGGGGGAGGAGGSGAGAGGAGRRGTPAGGGTGGGGANKNDGGSGGGGGGSNNGGSGQGAGHQRAASGPGGRHGEGEAEADEDMMDVDDEEAGDDKKYCLCQNVSFGDMVACDNDACPYEWFHWSCVGLKSEPDGVWFCPVCTEEMKRADRQARA